MNYKKGIEYCHSLEKRTLDKVIATGALTGSSPLWVIMYLYNRRRGQPLLFIQERLGQNNQPFPMLKFETLYAGSELTRLQRVSYHTPSSERELNETRTTSNWMKTMRRVGLNEIPQAVNVLRGQMSIIGPRPLPQDYLDEAGAIFPTEVKQWKEIALAVLPGLLGVNPHHRGWPVEMFPERLKDESLYIEQASFWLDISLISLLLTPNRMKFLKKATLQLVQK